MDFLLDALEEIAAGIFDRTANLLNLSCDVIFVDTSSTYWEADVADEEIELASAKRDEQAKAEATEAEEPAVPAEAAGRQFSNHSNAHPQPLPPLLIPIARTPTAGRV